MEFVYEKSNARILDGRDHTGQHYKQKGTGCFNESNWTCRRLVRPFPENKRRNSDIKLLEVKFLLASWRIPCLKNKIFWKVFKHGCEDIVTVDSFATKGWVTCSQGPFKSSHSMKMEWTYLKCSDFKVRIHQRENRCLYLVKGFKCNWFWVNGMK